eukprot:gene9447-1653_t
MNKDQLLLKHMKFTGTIKPNGHETNLGRNLSDSERLKDSYTATNRSKEKIEDEDEEDETNCPFGSYSASNRSFW